jgi:hypothetical protein
VQRESQPQGPFESSAPTAPPRSGGFEAPRYEVISLDCEITSYAPDDQPLF